MSKGSQFWGNASGKLGEQVLYRAGGEQRSRTYVAKIKNPRTYAQMKNRLLMLNVVSAFRALKPLLTYTFPQKKANQSAFNAFVSANKNNNAYYISKSDLESGACVPYGMQVSQGTIGVSLQPTMKAVTNVLDIDASPKYAWAIEGLFDFSDFKLDVERDAPGNRGDYGVLWLTDDELAKVLKEACVVALPSQYQLSVIHSEYADTDADQSQDMWQPSFTVFHGQAVNSYRRTYGLRPSSGLLKIGLHIASRVVNEDESESLTFDYMVVGNPSLMPSSCANICMGVILSYKDSAGIQVSTSRMCVVPSRLDGETIENPTSDYVEGGFYFEQVMEEYGYKAEGVLTSTVSDKPTVEEEGEEEEEEGI